MRAILAGKLDASTIMNIAIRHLCRMTAGNDIYIELNGQTLKQLLNTICVLGQVVYGEVRCYLLVFDGE